MTRKRVTAKKSDTAPKGDTPTPISPPDAMPVQRAASPEEQAQIQLQTQRGRAEVAVLKQRFAETDVAMTIAQAECGQLVQQNQMLQQENTRLQAEIAKLSEDAETGKESKTPVETSEA